MRKAVILWVLFLIMTSLKNFAQTLDWAPVGAKWYYEVGDGGGVTYVVYKCEKDTILNGISCRKIIIDTSEQKSIGKFFAAGGFANSIAYSGYPNNNRTDIPVAFTFQRNDTVFYYHWSCNQFVPVAYNLSDTTDRWYVMSMRYFTTNPLCPSMATITPTGIDTIDWNGKKLRKIYCKSKFNYFNHAINSNELITLCGSFISGIGWVGETNYYQCFFRGQTTSIIGGCLPVWYSSIVDEIYLGPLRCYYHPTYGWFNYLNKPCDTVSIVKKYTINETTINVYSVHPYLYIKGEKEAFPLEIEVYNTVGNLLYKSVLENENSKILMDNFPSSLLMVIIRDRNGNFYARKIIY